MRRFSNEGTRLICFDFDETYFPHDCTDAQLAAVRRLEDVLEANASRVSTMWVTGSSLESIQEKARRAQLRYWPHRIAASLGTELYRIDANGVFHREVGYETNFPTDFSNRVNQVLRQMQSTGIKYEEQYGRGESSWIRSYYVRDVTESWQRDVREMATAFGIDVNISRCNPKAGDPADAYDVNFYPLRAGKVSSVEYVSTTAGFRIEDSYAFGDSGNDVALLRRVGHGYLLQNATAQAKAAYPVVTERPYADGILDVLVPTVSGSR